MYVSIASPKFFTPVIGRVCAWAMAAAFCTLPAHASAAPILVNGSLTGPILGEGVPPPGWTVTTPTPDTVDVDHNSGRSKPVLFVATPSESPDGGTWVGLAANPTGGTTPVKIEAINQTVSGFTLGKSYTLKWYHANFGWKYEGQNYALTATNAIRVLADGVAIGTGSMLALGEGWVEESLNFVAADTDIDLTFTSVEVLASFPSFEEMVGYFSYQSIDGIRLSESDDVPPGQVPEPASLPLFASAGMALMLARRRNTADKATLRTTQT